MLIEDQKENKRKYLTKKRTKKKLKHSRKPWLFARVFERKEKKLKIFEGVLRSVWVLRSVSYEIY